MLLFFSDFINTLNSSFTQDNCGMLFLSIMLFVIRKDSFRFNVGEFVFSFFEFAFKNEENIGIQINQVPAGSSKSPELSKKRYVAFPGPLKTKLISPNSFF